MFRLSRYLLIFAIILFVSETSSGQIFDFRYEQFDTDDGLPSSEIYDLYEDPNKNIWLATDRGIVKYNGYEFVTYDTNDGLANLVNFSFQPVGDGSFWVNGLDGSLSFWDGSSFRPFGFNSALKEIRPRKNSWFDFLGLQGDKLFLQLVSASNKHIDFPLYSVNVKDGTVTEHGEGFWTPLDARKDEDLLVKRRINIIKNRNAVRDSIDKLKGARISTTHFQWDSLNRLKRVRYIGDIITGFNVSRDKSEWITTPSGVFHFEKGDLSKQPTVFFNGIGVTYVHESEDGSLWITSTDNGLFHVPNIDIRQFRPNGWAEGEAIYRMDIIEGILMGRSEKNKIFFVDRDLSSLYCSRSNGEEFDYSHLQDATIDELNGACGNLLGLVELDNKRLLNYNTRRFGIVNSKLEPLGPIYEHRVLSAIKDKNGILWIATTEGLFNWDVTNTPTTPKLTSVQENEYLRVNDVEADRDGIWVATPKYGLIYKTETFEHKLEHDKLTEGVFTSIFKQSDSTLWVGSNRGLIKIKYGFDNDVPEIQKAERFTTAHGLISNYINDVTFWNGELWLATDEGLCHFNPDHLKPITTTPELEIDYLEAKNETFEVKNRINLSRDRNDINIAYTGISHNKPKSGFYRYKINDEPWVSTNERKVSFLDLNHGKYFFSVQCRSDSGIWSETKSLTFTIQPHFLEQLWVKVAMAFMLAVLTFLFTRRYRKNWKRKLENENRLRRSELNTLRNQMNPHFMFNSLTAIQALIYKGSKNEASDYIGDFSSLMRKSLEYSRLENISLDEEIQFIESYLQLETKRFKKLFEYRIEVDRELDRYKIQVPALLIQPLLENSIKHGFRGIKKNGQIEVTFKEHHLDEIFEIVIMDNGTGLNLTSSSDSNESRGMGIVKDRISLIRENSRIKEVSFHVESEMGKGTLIRLLLPKKMLG